MEISKAAAGMLAGLCLALGAGGAYIATRGADSPAATVVPESGTISPDPAQLAGVEQSEGIVTESPVEPEVPAAVPPAARVPPPVERRAPAPRPQARTTRQPAVEEAPAPPPPAVEERRVAIPPAIEPVRAPEPEPVAQPELSAATANAEPPAPQFEDLVISADSVIGLQVETALTS
jgi:outer membrane biosynthesis protein TonB